jgi:response regulator RpfG family c-di-GMP phosphodiesterase
VHTSDELADTGSGVRKTRARRSRPKILVVDDEAAILETMAELLRRDYEPLVTSDVEEALLLLAEQDIALLMADQRMPGMSGVELLAQAALISPETVRVIFTGYSDIDAIAQAINRGRVFSYVAKPWRPPELLDLVSACVGRHELTMENRRLVAELMAAVGETAGKEVEAKQARVLSESLEGRNQVLEAALEDLRSSHWHLKRLQELLPICVYCHRVRVGVDDWQSVERYLAEHSDFLTHGVCPDCIGRAERDSGL